MLEHTLKTFRFINYLLVVLVIIALLLVARSIVSVSLSKKAQGPAAIVKTKATRPAVTRKNLMHYADILEENPFGPSLQLRPLNATVDTRIAEPGTLSDLTLVGAVVGSKNASFAILKVKSGPSAGKEEVFSLGENVFNYGKLSKVNLTSVEIVQGAVTHTLKIPFDKMSSKEKLPRKLAARKSKNSFARKVGDRQYVLDSKKVQESVANPEHILTDARLLPNFVDGKQEGFSISEVIPNGLYHNLGLKNGDILLKINGLEISNPEVAIQAMSALKGMNRVNLDIIRTGKNMSMSYQLR